MEFVYNHAESGSARGEHVEQPKDPPMPDVAERYRIENGFRLIEIGLNTVHQLFNSLDPSPFRERDLDADAEEFIVGAVRELPLATPLKLVFYLPEEETHAERPNEITQTIHGYFGYRAQTTRRELRFLLRYGRTAMLIAFVFLAFCLTLRALVFVPSGGPLDIVVGEGLMIIGWVAMWKPLEVLLYDWWPLRQRARLYDKLASISVDTRSASSAPISLRTA